MLIVGPGHVAQVAIFIGPNGFENRICLVIGAAMIRENKRREWRRQSVGASWRSTVILALVIRIEHANLAVHWIVHVNRFHELVVVIGNPGGIVSIAVIA